MIAELAAANAAYDVIKQSIQNGKEIYEAADAMAQYFGLKQEIQRKAHEHGYKSDLDAFMATEQLKAQEDELKQLMIWQGRGGMWNDWLQYQAQMKRSREEEALQQRRAKVKRKKMIIDGIIIALAIGCAIGAIGIGVWVLLTYSG